MKQTLLLLLSLLIGSSLASSSKFAYISPLDGSQWIKGSRVGGHLLHKVHFAISQKENTLDQCTKLLYKISDPESQHYGDHLRLDQVGKLFSRPELTENVISFLTSYGIDFSVTPNGEFVTALAPFSVWEALLETEFYEFTAKANSEMVVARCLSYSLPQEIEQSVDFVTHTVRFPPAKPSELFVSEGHVAAGGTTPSLINSYYNVTSNDASKSSQSLFEGLGQSYSPSDLSAFLSNYNLPNNKVSKVIGPNNPSQCEFNPNSCAEANLDVQYIMAVAQNAPTTYWSIASSSDMFVDWIVAVAGDSNAPFVHSMSYGSIAQEDPTNDMTRFNTEACKLGLRGLTLVIATGDDGVANFQARSDQSKCGFHPSFPATSPFVTAVGATQGPEVNSNEIVCASNTGGLITSGGGFSDFFERPAYQNAAVTAFLNQPVLPPTNQFNTKGRAYPDVALVGHNYQVFIGGQNLQVSGTSASTPSVAGLISIVNSMRISAGKKSLGFLNPALYKLKSDAFHDITVGANNCCAGQPGSAICCQYGFNATAGWDPTTGLGSINFKNFAQQLTALA